MSKSVSILVSIALLIAADRAMEYWRHAHQREKAQSIRVQMQQDASQLAPRPRVIPTNIPSLPGPEVIQL